MEDEDRYTRITLRLPKDLHGHLSSEADRTSKSLNAEIVERLSRTLRGDDTAKLMRSNTMLLRLLSDFVLLRQRHPEAMAPMEPAALQLAQTIKEAEDDTKLIEAAGPALNEYIGGMVDALNRATDILGPGWAAKDKVIMQSEVLKPAPADTGPRRSSNARKLKS